MLRTEANPEGLPIEVFDVYEGAPHGLSMVPEFAGRFDADLLAFARG
ncbi:hypothetical protein [Streptomyces sp. AF1A]